MQHASTNLPSIEATNATRVHALAVAPAQATDDLHTLVVQIYPRVLRMLVGMLGDPTDAEDVAQEVFIRLYRAERLPLAHRLSSWLRKVTLNAAINWRREQKTRTSYHDAFSRVAEPELPSWAEASGHERLLASVAGLHSGPRQVLVLYYVQGLTISELAGALAIGVSAAKMRLKRARDELRRVYWDGAGTPRLEPDVG